MQQEVEEVEKVGVRSSEEMEVEDIEVGYKAAGGRGGRECRFEIK
jgi:hypothetical protein